MSVDLAALLLQQRQKDVERLQKAAEGQGEAPTIYKAMEMEVKDADGDRMVVIGSDESEDRDGDVIRASGWELDNYRRNPVGLWAHMYHQPPVFRTLEVGVEGTRLRHVIEWDSDPFAQLIKGKYERGFMRAFSVGFRPKEWKARREVTQDENGEPRTRFLGFEFTRQELLELSAVPVPANPNALALAAKALSESSNGIPNWLKDLLDPVKAFADRVAAIEEQIKSFGKLEELAALVAPIQPITYTLDWSALPKEKRDELMTQIAGTVAEILRPQLLEEAKAAVLADNGQATGDDPQPPTDIAPDDAEKLLTVLRSLREGLPQVS